jgi:hypothetical protein
MGSKASTFLKRHISMPSHDQYIRGPIPRALHHLIYLPSSIKMSDPFAVRMTFKRSYLEKMTSSPASQMRAAVYAIKFREQDEDLHSCILEQLEYVSSRQLFECNFSLYVILIVC